jgi:TonB family protein
VRHPRWVVPVLVIAAGCAALAQTNSHPPMSKDHVVVVSLFDPIYPSLARQARISGNVELKLGIRLDGSIESAIVVSGPPMLTQAALNSAQQSRFECRGCEDKVTSHFLVYSFQFAFVADPDYPCPERSEPLVTHSENQVTIVSEPALVYPIFSNVRVRSAKCAYLWQCSDQWGGEDYYFYRVRSPRCLGLWNCSQRLREPFATCNRLHRKILY